MKKTLKAFTLIELLVVVSIILILSLVVMTAVYNARKESRDTARATTAEQLSLGIRLYKEAEGKYPDFPIGVEIGAVPPEAIDAQLAPFIKEIPKDPLTQGSGDEYEYWYYPNFLCKGERHDVVLVKNMEMGDNGNFDEVCGGAILPLETGLIPRAYAAASCPVTIVGGSTSVNRPTSGTKQIRYGWPNINTADIAVIDPNGIPYTVYNRQSTEPYTFTPTSPVGTYTINVYADINTPSSLCGTLQVNLVDTSLPAETQCNDGVDNDDAEDLLIDMADPGCTSSTDDSEVNSVAPPPEYVQSTYYTQSSYSTQQNYTDAAYIVFIN